MPATDDTRERLLDAAGGILARDGFRAARVRDICAAAGANVAAVNYHFGDKLGLYRAVFAHAFAIAGPSMAGLPAGGSPAERLTAWVRDFVRRILDDGKPAWIAKLMAREMSDPTEVLDELVEHGIRPHFAELQATVRALVPGADPATVRRCALSVVAQCVFYHHSRPVIERLHPRWRLTPAEAERIAVHIARFSLAGLAAIGGGRA